MDNIRVRPVRLEDGEALSEIGEFFARGMTTLPRNLKEWQERLDQSIQTFDKLWQNPEKIVEGCFILVCEVNGKLAGLSAIYNPVGLDRPFYSYHVAKLDNLHPERNLRFQTEVLYPTNIFTGTCELGTLIVHPHFQGKNIGRLLSKSRLSLINAYPSAFADTLFAEMRGLQDEKRQSPLWNALGKRFFKLEFGEADIYSTMDLRFISDLMPKFPIYTALLNDEARECIGVAHQEARGAYQMLIAEGFRYHNYVDIFDGGPCLNMHKQDLKISTYSQQCTIFNFNSTPPSNKPTHLITNASLSGANSHNLSFGFAIKNGDGQLSTPADWLEKAEIKAGDTITASPLHY